MPCPICGGHAIHREGCLILRETIRRECEIMNEVARNFFDTRSREEMINDMTDMVEEMDVRGGRIKGRR